MDAIEVTTEMIERARRMGLSIDLLTGELTPFPTDTDEN